MFLSTNYLPIDFITCFFKLGCKNFNLWLWDSELNSTDVLLFLSPNNVSYPTSGPRPIGSTLMLVDPLKNISKKDYKLFGQQVYK